MHLEKLKKEFSRFFEEVFGKVFVKKLVWLLPDDVPTIPTSGLLISQGRS